jgi:DNA polymerase III sliding clamp (beta) subunit (PCNA family)
MITINRDSLLEAVGYVAQVIPNKPLREEFGFLSLTAEDTTLSIVAKTADTVLRYRLQLEHGSNFTRLAIPAGQLKDLLSKSEKGGTITISLDGSSVVIESSDGSRYELPTVDPELINFDISVDPKNRSDFEPDGLADRLKAVSFATAEESARHAISAVCFDGKSFIGTDGHRLAMVETTGEKASFPCLMPPEAVKLIESGPSPAAQLAWDKSVLSVTWINGNFEILQIISKQMDGRYPNCSQILPMAKLPEDQILIETGIFSEAIKRAATVSDSEKRSVEITGKDSSDILELRSETTRGKSQSRHQLDTALVADFKIKIDPAYLLDICKHQPGQIALNFYSHDKPIMFVSESNLGRQTNLVMPLV